MNVPEGRVSLTTAVELPFAAQLRKSGGERVDDPLFLKPPNAAW